jgi:hypothetical protein
MCGRKWENSGAKASTSMMDKDRDVDVDSKNHGLATKKKVTVDALAVALLDLIAEGSVNIQRHSTFH